ncbi:MAG: trigger factor [Desulfobacterota bacterium]|nr:trigger factor [Thermodesulfobacteriota bacterium]
MKVDLAHVSDIEKRMTVVIPPETVDDRISTAYRELRKTVHLKGFRPGKAPLPLLERYFKAQVEEDVISRIVQDTYPKALEEVHAAPISQPKIENGVLERGKEFSYTAVFEIKPDITVQGYHDIEIGPQQEITVTDDDVARELELLRERFATLKDVTDRGIRKGDFAVLDINGTVDGASFKHGTQKDFFIEVDDTAYIPGFADQIVGLEAGATTSFRLTVPQDFSLSEIAGKTVDVTVKVKTVKEKVLPQLDDEFAKDVGDYQSLDGLKEKLRQELLDRKKYQAESAIREKIYDTLLEKNPFPLPRALLEEQLKNMLYETDRMLASQGLTLDDLGQSTGQLVERYREPAERQARIALLLEAIARQEGISAGAEDFEKEYQKIADQTRLDVATVKARISTDMLTPRILQEKALNFIMAKAKRTET